MSYFVIAKRVVSIRREEQERGYSTTSRHNNVNLKKQSTGKQKDGETTPHFAKVCKRGSFQPSDVLTA
jgi:hypothetical protein